MSIELFAAETLTSFCVDLLTAIGVPPADAAVTAEALVTTDLRGIDSHGIAHLGRYVRGLEAGVMNPLPNLRIVQETASTALVDGDRGLGFVVSHFSMNVAIAKAQQCGSGWVVVRNSTHHGAAGFWAGMALPHGLIGFASTNATPNVAPAFGARPMLGTNPIAMAVPTSEEAPFLLDMATSVVPVGRLEIYSRTGKPVPTGWVIDPEGQTLSDAVDCRQRLRTHDAAILPLGGAGDEMSGYKGYGLAMGVEILTSVLAGYAGQLHRDSAGEAHLGHFFGALSVDAFRPLGEFRAAMDNRLRELKEAPALPGHSVRVPGQKEFEMTQERRRCGIPLHEAVVAELREIGERYDVTLHA